MIDPMGISKENSTHQRYSKKVGINLARKEYDKKGLVVFLFGLCAIAGMSFAVAKFGVIDQYDRLNRAQSQYADVHEQNEALAAVVADYPKVQLEYRTYSTEWMDESYVDRKDILDMVESELIPCGNVSTILINGNTALVTMSGMTLEEVSVMVMSLKLQPIVSAVALNTAQTVGKDGSDITCTLTISLRPAPEEQAVS